MNLKRTFSFIVLGLLLLSGCDQLLNISTGTGSINLTISDDLNSRTITPDFDMSASSLNILGEGPEGATFEETVTPGSSQYFNYLTPGIWLVTVEAYNEAGSYIGYGEVTVTVVDGETENATVIVTPVEGYGTLNLDLTWANEVLSPSIVASLTPVNGSQIGLNFSIIGNSASYSGSFMSGYYQLNVRLYDGGADTGKGYNEAVRIIYNQTSSFNMNIEDVYQESNGNIDVVIDTDLENPLAITFEGASNYLVIGETMTVIATVDNTPDSYQWYLNGDLLEGETGATITVGTDLGEGYYYLSLLVNMGNILSSESLSFMVTYPGAEKTYGIYLRSQVGEPWGQIGNQTVFDLVFPDGEWETAFFETVDINNILTPSNVILIDGSDDGAIELNTFLTDHLTQIEDWVAAGGTLLLNSGPNEGSDINFGFDGTMLIDTNNQSSVTAANAEHPIFIGPETPITTSYTGSSFSHGHITGNNLTPLLVGGEFIVLAEKNWGSGVVMFGSMTMPNYHTPTTEAINLRANMVHYLKTAAGGNTTTTILFDDAWAVNGDGSDPETFYGVDYGVHFDNTNGYGVIGGMDNGDPGSWAIQGTNGTAAWGIWQGYHSITWDTEVSVVSIDFLRGHNDVSGTINAYYMGTLVDTATISLTGEFDFDTVTFTGTVDKVDWDINQIFGVDNIVYQ